MDTPTRTDQQIIDEARPWRARARETVAQAKAALEEIKAAAERLRDCPRSEFICDRTV
jgi:hypothetical protein